MSEKIFLCFCHLVRFQVEHHKVYQPRRSYFTKKTLPSVPNYKSQRLIGFFISTSIYSNCWMLITFQMRVSFQIEVLKEERKGAISANYSSYCLTFKNCCKRQLLKNSKTWDLYIAKQLFKYLLGLKFHIEFQNVFN